jgi:PAS domain S-box-containing protein
MTPSSSRPILLLGAGALAAALAFLLAGRQVLPLLAIALPPLLVGILAGGRDPRNEWEQQAAFEEAERDRADRRAAAVFESFIGACPVAVELYGVDGRLRHSNKAAERLLGKVPPPGLSLFEPRGLKRAGLLEPQLKRVLAGARVETPPTWYDATEIGLPGIPGTRVCFRATVFPLFDAENAISRIAVLYEDATESQRQQARLRELESAAPPTTPTGPPPAEDIRDLEFRRRKTEHSLRESEERYRTFVENARGYVVIRFTEEGRVAAVSPSISTIWGISADTILTDSSAFFAQVAPGDLARVRETDARIRATGTWPDDYRFRVRNKTTDEEHWVELRGAVSTALGRRTYDAIALDVTRLLEAEQQLARRQASLDSIVASTADGVATLDTELKVTTWSPGAESATALRAGEAVGRPLAELYPDLEKTGFLAAIRRTLREQRIERHEAFYHDGREERAGWFDVTSYPFETGVLLIIRNRSGQRRTEADGRRSEARLRALLATPGLIVALKDRDLRYRLANGPARRMLGLDETAGVEGKTDKDLLKRPVADLLTGHDRRALEGTGPVELEVALPDAISPQSAWYRLVKTPFADLAGDVLGVLTVGWDVTRQVHAFQELALHRVWLEKFIAEHERLTGKAGEELKRWQG